jgi:hypothetical protein
VVDPLKIVIGAAYPLAIAAMAPAAAAVPVDIELVLAVDVSGSVDAGEQELQRVGIADAFRDPTVVEAIARLPAGLAVAVVGWAGAGQCRTIVGWRHLTNRQTAEDFAGRVAAAFPVAFDAAGKTALGDALSWSVAELAHNAFHGRPVIDVSGDGRSTDGAYPGPVRDRATAAGVTINGLAIVNQEPYLADYYRRTVIGGPGAFVMSATGYESFAEAIRLKLLRELAPGPTAAVVTSPPPPRPPR